MIAQVRRFARTWAWALGVPVYCYLTERQAQR